ncbi:unnamed protein product [Allacma fusca]|uniref:Uncharacterized protein n=1 Tax=Allacma fusca TaxID=39272 RepID=A0A8J2JRL9_9HEXA|nr:unnamed protein product [Allacma fusca]
MICFLGKTDNCNFTVLNYTNYLDHLLQVHHIFKGEAQNFLKIRQKCSKDSPENYHHWISMSTTFDSKTFIFRSFKIASDIYWSVGIIGNDVEASKYSANIRIGMSDRSGANKGKPHHVMQTAVHSVRLFRYKFRQDQPHAQLKAAELKNIASVKANVSKGNGWKFEWQTEYSLGLKDPPVSSSTVEIN